MRMHIRLVVVAAIAVAWSFTLVGSAGAGRLSVSNLEFRIVFPAATPMGANGWTCPVTLTGSFHTRTFIKRVDDRIGKIESAAKGTGCTFNEGASAVTFPLAATLPWDVQYSSISGMLPRIARLTIRVIGLSWLVTALGLSCLYQSTESSPALGHFIPDASRFISTFEWEANARIPLSAGAFCPATATLRGSGSVTEPDGTTLISLTLI